MRKKEIINCIMNTGLTDGGESGIFITDEPKFPNYIGYPRQDCKERYVVDSGVIGRGCHKNPLIARIKALGECIERLCLVNPNEGKLITGNYGKGDGFIDPALFDCYSSQQIPNKAEYLEKRRSATYKWWPAYDLLSMEEVYVPAQMIFLSEGFEDEIPIRGERISTGAAFGLKQENRALESGLLEVIERDSTISSYLSKREIAKIVDLPNELQETLDYFQRYRLEPFIFDITTDTNIPSVLAILIDESGVGDSISVGSKSSSTFKEAIAGSIYEAVQCRTSSRLLNEIDEKEFSPNEREIVSMYSRFVYWKSTNRVHNLDFWLKSEKEIRYSELQGGFSLDKITNFLSERGYHLYAADLSIPEISDQGFEVLKVIIPEMHPLYLDERAKALYSKHHGEIEDDANLKPHPLT